MTTLRWRVVWSSLYSLVPALMSGTWLAGTWMNAAYNNIFSSESKCNGVNIVPKVWVVHTHTHTHTHTHKLKSWSLIALGSQRSTVHPQVVVMVLEWSRCWRSCPHLSSVMCISRPGTSLMVEAPLGMEGPWGRPRLHWLFLIRLMLKGWAVDIFWATNHTCHACWSYTQMSCIKHE